MQGSASQEHILLSTKASVNQHCPEQHPFGSVREGALVGLRRALGANTQIPCNKPTTPLRPLDVPAASQKGQRMLL